MIKFHLDNKNSTVIEASTYSREGDFYLLTQDGSQFKIHLDKVLFIEEELHLARPAVSSKPAVARESTIPAREPMVLAPPTSFLRAVEDNLSFKSTDDKTTIEEDTIDIEFFGALNDTACVICDRRDLSATIVSERLANAIFADPIVSQKLYQYNVIGLEKKEGIVRIETATAKLVNPSGSFQDAVAKIAEVTNKASTMMLGGLESDENISE